MYSNQNRGLFGANSPICQQFQNYFLYPPKKKTKIKKQNHNQKKKKIEYLLLLEDSSSVGLASRYKSKTAVLNKPINI